MKQNWTVVGLSDMLLMLSACAEGRWMYPTNSEAQTRQDWDRCKTEVLSGQEHRKNTMAGENRPHALPAQKLQRPGERE